MRLFLLLLALAVGPAFAQERPLSGTDLGSGRLVDFEPAREAVLSNEQMALVKEDRSYAAILQPTGDNTVTATRGNTLYMSTDRDGGCSEAAPCIILIGDLLYVPFASEGGLGTTRSGSDNSADGDFGPDVQGFLMPQQLKVSEEQAKAIADGPMADHLRMDDGTVTGGRGTTLYSTDRGGDCTAGACLIGLEQDGFLSIWGVP